MASAAVCLAAAAKPRLPRRPSAFAARLLPSNPSLLRRRSLLRPRPIRVRRALPLPVIRAAGLPVPSVTKPGNAVETDSLPSEVRNRAMEAVDSFGGRVTIGDVAGKAGLKVGEAERALQALAADTGGFLEVSDEGDVLYIFRRDYRSKLAAKSFRMKVEPLLEKSKTGFDYFIRVSFGTALVASIVIVYTTIILALVSGKSDDNNRGRRGGRPYASSFTSFIRLSDLFWYWDPNYYSRKKTKSSGGMNFVESVFSFVFGDGDPNYGLEEKRWKMIGQYISSNGGVITAEEVAPYLDVLPGNGAVDDESYILPVLLRFDGHPDVDDEGNIVYRFPSLQRTASSKTAGIREFVGTRQAGLIGGVDEFFQEKIWTFSKTNASERAMVAALGGLNLFGVIVLGAMLKSTDAAPRELISFASATFPFLQIYAASFFAIPFFRWIFLRKMNGEIERRNQARELRARALQMPDSTLQQKLISARDMAGRTVIGSDRIVYSTEKDLVDQDYESREWSRRLNEI